MMTGYKLRYLGTLGDKAHERKRGTAYLRLALCRQPLAEVMREVLIPCHRHVVIRIYFSHILNDQAQAPSLDTPLPGHLSQERRLSGPVLAPN